VADLRASSLIGQIAYDRSGKRLGRIADLIVGDDLRVQEVVFSDRPWGRLLGYERREVTGPWLLETLANRILRRHIRRMPWHEIQLINADAPTP
jgi:hypothetical protein